MQQATEMMEQFMVVMLTADRFGNANSAYLFNGTSDYINFFPGSRFSRQMPVTITAWVKWDNSKSTIGLVMGNDVDSAYYTGFIFTINGGVALISYGDNG